MVRVAVVRHVVVRCLAGGVPQLAAQGNAERERWFSMRRAQGRLGGDTAMCQRATARASLYELLAVGFVGLGLALAIFFNASSNAVSSSEQPLLSVLLQLTMPGNASGCDKEECGNDFIETFFEGL